MYSAIQFIGTQRSGSNLLRVTLDQFPEVFGPHPPHILVTFYPLLKYYGDLEQSSNFSKLIDDICKLIELNPVPWEGIHLNRKKIFSRCRRRTLLEAFIQIHEIICIENSKSVWCCKSMESLYLFDKYREEGFEPLYLYLYRDGRDVALSFKKAIVGEKHIYNLATKWKADQEACLKELEILPSNRYIKIKYEDYIANPPFFIDEICKRIGLIYNNAIENFHSSEESKRTAAGGKMWENVTKPLIKNNYGKFLKELPSEDVTIFEAVAGDTLIKLGYQLYQLKPGETKHFSPETIAGFNNENTHLKQQILIELPPEDLLKRKLQSDFIATIKNYA